MTEREALKRLVNAVLEYQPREDHDWRCEIRTAEVGWKPGQPPVIRCECGFLELGLAVQAATDVLAEPAEGSIRHIGDHEAAS